MNALHHLAPSGGLFANRTLWIALLAWIIAQVWKFLGRLLLDRKFEPALLWAPGGMPSAHSALVAALAISVGMNVGFNSPDFAIATGIAMIVMYDAAGIRQAAGKHARVINRIVDELLSGYPVTEDRLREILGHTPLQVVVGGMLGALSAWLLNLWL
jgi:acid phosphatase family membrane protein YuiD